MGRRPIVAVAVFILIILLSAGSCFAQEGMKYGISYGLMEMISDGNEYWDMGSSLRANVFIPIHANVMLGGQFTYITASPNVNGIKTGFRKDYYGPGSHKETPHWDISGDMSSIEVAPSIRVLTPVSEAKRSRYFFQGGVGYYKLKFEAEDNDAGGTVDLISDSSNSFGFNAGGGMLIGGFGSFGFDVCALYHYILTEGDNVQYFTVNLGVVYGY